MFVILLAISCLGLDAEDLGVCLLTAMLSRSAVTGFQIVW